MALSRTHLDKFKSSKTVASLKGGNLDFFACAIACGKSIDNEDEVEQLVMALLEVYPDALIKIRWPSLMIQIGNNSVSV